MRRVIRRVLFAGWWSDEANRNDYFDYQDVVILKKRSA
jgi:hypothetical protein